MPSAEANKPATLYLALAASNTPLGLLPSVLFTLHAETHAPTHARNREHPHTHGDDARTYTQNSHEDALARAREGHSPMMR